MDGNISLIFSLLHPTQPITSALKEIDFEDHTTRPARVSFVITRLRNINYVGWKHFLKVLRKDDIVENRELGRMLSYVANRPVGYRAES